jgi:hypothetical protein
VTIALAARPRDPVAAPKLAVPADIRSAGNNDRQLELAVRIAVLLKRPIGFIDDAYCRLASLEPAQVRAIATHPAFRAPINRAVEDSLGLTGSLGVAAADIDTGMLSRLASSPRSRLAVLFATAPIEEVRQVAWMLAAAVLSKRIRGLVLKTDRELARDILGADGFDVATHEAPVLHPALCELDAKTDIAPLFTADDDAAGRQEHIMAFGLQIAGRFLDTTEPALGKLFSLRVPPSASYRERDQAVKPFGDVHCQQVVKFIRRRQQSWSAIIG